MGGDAGAKARVKREKLNCQVVRTLSTLLVDAYAWLRVLVLLLQRFGH